MTRIDGVRRTMLSGRSSELGLRVASAAVLACLALVATWLGGWLFAGLWLAAAIVMVAEWVDMTGTHRRSMLILVAALGLAALALLVRTGPWPSAPAIAVAVTLVGLLLAAGSARDRLWAVAGWGYAAVALVIPILVRDRPDLGAPAILWIFAVVWSTDILAFFVGRRLGGPKLWRRVSPGKTWSGFAGGLIAGTMAGVAVAAVARSRGSVLPFGLPEIAAWSALASIAGQLGDLGESALKRRFSVKDSGHLIPGHGGVLDRLDAFVAVAFLVGLALLGARLFGTSG